MRVGPVTIDTCLPNIEFPYYYVSSKSLLVYIDHFQANTIPENLNVFHFPLSVRRDAPAHGSMRVKQRAKRPHLLGLGVRAMPPRHIHRGGRG